MHTQPRIQIKQIPSGYLGTLDTACQVRDLIKSGAKNFTVRQSAIDILKQRSVRPKDYLGEIKALFEWVQHNIRYTKDTFRVEVLHSAKRMLELRAGDCDDMTILLGAMLEAVGHPVRLVLSGANPARPDLFSHIYLEVQHQGRWIPLDATMPHPMGWSSRAPVKKIIPLENHAAGSESITLHGLDTPAEMPKLPANLLAAIRDQAIRPRDPRIRSLWNLLHRHGLLHQSSWLKAVLQRIWFRGLAPKPRPRLATRLERLLRAWGVLPAQVAADPVDAVRPDGELRIDSP